jgi:hypothetical protein
MSRAKRLRRPASTRAADLVEHPVAERLMEIGLKRPGVSWLERPDPLKNLGQRVLDDIVGIEGTACPGRQPPVGPPLQAGQVAGAEVIERPDVPAASTRE